MIIPLICNANFWWLAIAVSYRLRRASVGLLLRHIITQHTFNFSSLLDWSISLGVGKTCLLLRYASDSFSPTFITTIGIDFKIKNILLDGKRIKLQVNRIPFLLFTHPFTKANELFYFFFQFPPSDMGHGRTGEISYNYNIILQRSPRNIACLWLHW